MCLNLRTYSICGGGGMGWGGNVAPSVPLFLAPLCSSANWRCYTNWVLDLLRKVTAPNGELAHMVSLSSKSRILFAWSKMVTISCVWERFHTSVRRYKIVFWSQKCFCGTSGEWPIGTVLRFCVITFPGVSASNHWRYYFWLRKYVLLKRCQNALWIFLVYCANMRAVLMNLMILDEYCQWTLYLVWGEWTISGADVSVD